MAQGKTILILGGGIGGVVTASRLRKNPLFSAICRNANRAQGVGKA